MVKRGKGGKGRVNRVKEGLGEEGNGEIGKVRIGDLGEVKGAEKEPDKVARLKVCEGLFRKGRDRYEDIVGEDEDVRELIAVGKF